MVIVRCMEILMKKYFNIISLLVPMFLVCQLALTDRVAAALYDEVVISGEVGNMTEELITLKTETGNVLIPRKALGKIDVRSGAKMQVKVSLAEVVELNKKHSRVK